MSDTSTSKIAELNDLCQKAMGIAGKLFQTMGISAPPLADQSATHTPGPWKVEPLQWDHGASIAIVAKGQIICTIAPENEDDDPDMYTAKRGPNDEANALLIAAAPTMNSFIATIARITQDGEEREGDTEPFIMENDNAVSTLNRLIEDAREILKAAK